MKPAIAIFVKTPGHSPIKTRLAATVGRAFAEQWHAQAAEAVAAVVREACRANAASAYWAVAEADALADPRWDGLPVLGQGEGGLGARMHAVHRALVERHGAGILLGADAPQIDPAVLREALVWLDEPQPRSVMGRAADGGFWLFGSNRAHPLGLWESIPYSVPDTADRFRAAPGDWGAWLELLVLSDVDTAGDLAACHAALTTLPAPLPAQSALRAWMDAQVADAILGA
jgi:glycosyltransferase A (GT-A) superfamily protein (DUF2064 family)